LETLKRRAEFDRVRAGRKWAAKGFVLQAMPREGQDPHGPARFGFAVSGKALAAPGLGGTSKRAGAVVRNRAKRRLKEALRLSAPSHAREGYDYVIIGRREVLHQSFADLLEDMQFAFGKVHRPQRAGDGKPLSDRERKTSAGDV
jgi:ribonuclease P protein component